MRSAILFCILIVGLVLSAAIAAADDEIRYKPVLVQSGVEDVSDPMVLIVDTEEGHLWLWEQKYVRRDNDTVAPVTRLSYQGKVGPGAKVEAPKAALEK